MSQRNGDAQNGEAANGRGMNRSMDRSGRTAQVIEPHPEIAKALRKDRARLIPAGFCVSVQKSAPAVKIEVHLSDKQWKKFVEDDAPKMRLIVERKDDGQFKLTRRSAVKPKAKVSGQAQPQPKRNGHGKTSPTRVDEKRQLKVARSKASRRASRRERDEGLRR